MNIDIKTITVKDFGDALKDLMGSKDLSYNQLAYKCKLSPQFLHQIATKKVLPPKDKFVIKIAKSLEVGPEYFYEYRLRRLVDLCRADKEFLDYCLSLAEKFQKKISNRSVKTGTARAREKGKEKRKEIAG